MEPKLTVTDLAKCEIKRLLSTEKKDGFRVSIIGGGCSGLKTKFEISSPTEVDKIVDIDGGSVIVDPKSWLFLQGATLDFKNGLNEYGFQLEVPGAKRKCGCGESFSV